MGTRLTATAAHPGSIETALRDLEWQRHQWCHERIRARLFHARNEETPFSQGPGVERKYVYIRFGFLLGLRFCGLLARKKVVGI